MFKMVKPWTAPAGETMICWNLEPGTILSQSTVFRVEYSRPGGPWELVGETTDSCCLTDTSKRDLGRVWEGFYRVVVDSPGKPPVYSCAVGAGMGFPSKREWLHAREIVRQAYVDLFKGGGRQGLLSIRKRWGVKCPNCREWVTGKPTSSTCGTCLGTGFTGGYHPPIEYWVKSGPGKDVTRRPTEMGMVSPVREEVWGVAWPMVSELDIWTDDSTAQRHEVTTVAFNTEYAGVPLTWKMNIARTDAGPVQPVWSDPFTDALVDYEPVGNNQSWRPSFDFNGGSI